MILTMVSVGNCVVYRDNEGAVRHVHVIMREMDSELDFPFLTLQLYIPLQNASSSVRPTLPLLPTDPRSPSRDVGRVHGSARREAPTLQVENSSLHRPFLSENNRTHLSLSWIVVRVGTVTDDIRLTTIFKIIVAATKVARDRIVAAGSETLTHFGSARPLHTNSLNTVLLRGAKMSIEAYKHCYISATTTMVSLSLLLVPRSSF